MITPPAETSTAENQTGSKASLSSFADRNIAKRINKVTPIVETYRRYRGPENIAQGLVLDIGSGSGVIGPAVAASLRLGCIGIDVADQRVNKQAPFAIASCEMLPFQPASFDYAICNHIIEHVFNQGQLLGEIRRVLKPGGLCYLATPNKYALLEPHYKLPLLSWLPQGWADGLVRLMRRGNSYDVQPVTRKDVRRLAALANLRATDLTLDLAASPQKFGRAGLLNRFVGLFPRWLIRQLLIIVPSQVWVMEANE